MKFFTCCNARAYWRKQQFPYWHTEPVRAKNILKQIVMRIQLTALIIGLAFLNVSANVWAQKVTLKTKNAQLVTVFNEIKKQTGYLFWYEDNLLSNSKNVTLDLKNASIEDALDACIKDQALTYSINDKTIVVKAKQKTFLDRVIDAIKAINVKGKVLEETGQVLAGANVKVKGTTQETTTNHSGEFYLENVDEKAILQISYLGYVTKEVNVSSTVIVNLVQSTANLQEVEVNAGYYKVKERERTGSISRVDAKTIGQQPISNPLAALIGRMPGVNIEQNSGINGGGFKVEIRGQNSLRNTASDNGNNPLYVINGVPFPSSTLSDLSFGVSGVSGLGSPLNSINPLDIESIEVLKDADATAIYGSRGANGVVLITTKKPKSGQANYEINVQQGTSVISKKLALMNTEQYLAMRAEAFSNDGVNPANIDYDVNGTWDRSRYTDWQDVLIGGTANSTTVGATLNGGSENTRYSFSGTFNRQTTVLPVDFSEQRGTGTLNLTHTSSNKKFSASFSSTYALDQNRLPKADFTQYIKLAPNAPELYDAQGNLNWGLTSSGAATWVNPVSSAKQPYAGKTGNFLTSGTLNYEIIPGLSLKGNVGYTAINFRESILQPIAALAPSQSATGINRIKNTAVQTWSVEPQLDYRFKIGNGLFETLIGSSFQATSQTGEFISGTGYTSDLLLANIASAPTRTAINSQSEYRYNALFARINYNYNGAYILNLTGRRDGSSRFGPEKQFANFGALGGAVIFTKLNFIKSSLPFLSFGKIRGSYGITGSDQIPDYGYLETYSGTNPYIDGSGVFPSQIANPDFSWETNKKLEAAIELGFMADRIMLAANWYRNRSSNQLVGYKLPDITGFSSIQYNLPATVQNTGWELEVRTVNVSGKALSWTSSFNITIPRNKLLEYPGIEGSTYANTYTVGYSLYHQRKYRYLGLDAATGTHQFQDLNGNNVMDAGDRQPANKSFTSHYYGGLQNSFSYKGFSLDFFVQFVSKTVPNPFMSNTGLAALPGSMNNQLVDLLDRWRQPGDQAKFAKFTQNYVPGGAGLSFEQLTSSDYHADASFIRLKNVSVSYNLPRTLLDKLKLQNARLFVLGQNLATITSYPGDPEVANLRVLPTLRSITAGLSLSL